MVTIPIQKLDLKTTITAINTGIFTELEIFVILLKTGINIVPPTQSYITSANLFPFHFLVGECKFSFYFTWIKYIMHLEEYAENLLLGLKNCH